MLQLSRWSFWAVRTVFNAKRIKSLQRRYFIFLQCRWTCDSSWRKDLIRLSMAPNSVAIFICICFVFFPSFLKSKVWCFHSCLVFFMKMNDTSVWNKKYCYESPHHQPLMLMKIWKKKLRYGGKKRKRQNLLGVVWCANVWLLSALTPEELLLCQSRISNTSQQIWGKI